MTLDPRLPPIVIDDVRPRTPSGFPAKGLVGERLPVSAVLVADGHDLLGARVCWRKAGARRWESAPLREVDGARWIGELTPAAVGMHRARRRGVDRPLRHVAARDRGEGRRWPGRGPRARGGGPAPRRAGGRLRRQRPRPAPRRVGGRAPHRLLARRAPRCGVRRRRRRAARHPPRRPPLGVGPPIVVGRPTPGRGRGLVRAVPAVLRRPAGRRRPPGLRGGPRLRRRLPAPDPPHRHHEPQGAGQHAHAGPARPRQPVGHRRRHRRP